MGEFQYARFATMLARMAGYASAGALNAHWTIEPAAENHAGRVLAGKLLNKFTRLLTRGILLQ
jgi:hypothetical protein